MGRDGVSERAAVEGDRHWTVWARNFRSKALSGTKWPELLHLCSPGVQHQVKIMVHLGQDGGGCCLTWIASHGEG